MTSLFSLFLQKEKLIIIVCLTRWNTIAIDRKTDRKLDFYLTYEAHHRPRIGSPLWKRLIFCVFFLDPHSRHHLPLRTTLKQVSRNIDFLIDHSQVPIPYAIDCYHFVTCLINTLLTADKKYLDFFGKFNKIFLIFLILVFSYICPSIIQFNNFVKNRPLRIMFMLFNQRE